MANQIKQNEQDDRRDDYYYRRHYSDENYAGYGPDSRETADHFSDIPARDFVDRRRLKGPVQGKRSGRKRPGRSLDFSRYAADGNHFINQVADELNVGRNIAARVTRAVLHAVRDRIPPEDAVEFAQGLPMALKGVYFDQYDLSKAPVVIRHPEEFIDYVRYKDGMLADRDFPDHASVEEGVSAVFKVLERNMDYGQVEQVRRLVNDELVYMMC